MTKYTLLNGSTVGHSRLSGKRHGGFDSRTMAGYQYGTIALADTIAAAINSIP